MAQHGEKQQHYHEKQQEPLPHLIFTSPYKLMIIGYNECPRLASLASTLVLPVFPGASARQVLAEASLTDLSRDSAEGIPNYVEQKQSPHDFRHRGFVLALPIFPGRRQPSIVTVNELNYCVRNGNRCTLTAINTNYLGTHPEN